MNATDTILTVLKQSVTELRLVYLFGCRAAGCEGARSDYDVAHLASETLDPVTRWKLEGQLADALATPVDLIDFSTPSTVMQFQAVNTGKILLSADVSVDDEFRMHDCRECVMR